MLNGRKPDRPERPDGRSVTVTRRQAEVLDTIRRLFTELGRCPTHADIGAAMGITVGAAGAHLHVLRSKGLLDWKASHRGTLRVTTSGKRLRIVDRWELEPRRKPKYEVRQTRGYERPRAKRQICPKCCDLSHRRDPNGCAGCGLPFVPEGRLGS